MPDADWQSARVSGCRARKSASSPSVQSSRAASIRFKASGSNMARSLFRVRSSLPVPGPEPAIKVAIVDDAARLELCSRQRTLRHQLHDGIDAKLRAQALAHRHPEALQSIGPG